MLYLKFIFGYIVFLFGLDLTEYATGNSINEIILLDMSLTGFVILVIGLFLMTVTAINIIDKLTEYPRGKAMRLNKEDGR